MVRHIKGYNKTSVFNEIYQLNIIIILLRCGLYTECARHYIIYIIYTICIIVPFIYLVDSNIIIVRSELNP